MRNDSLNIAGLIAFHDGLLARWYPSGGPIAERFANGLWHWIERNHVRNTMLWDEEDSARRTDVPDREIVRCKRCIDRYNQDRNDAIETIDVCLLEALEHTLPRPDARLHSETPGAIIDRLSILALKIHHMHREAEREGAG